MHSLTGKVSLLIKVQLPYWITIKTPSVEPKANQFVSLKQAGHLQVRIMVLLLLLRKIKSCIYPTFCVKLVKIILICFGSLLLMNPTSLELNNIGEL